MGLKHVGRIKKNKRKIIVAYRTVPGEPDNCIVVTTENLMADEHDALIRIVESDVGQQANEFADAMARSQLPDGRNMLAAFHTTGKLVKVPTTEVEMTFDRSTSIMLSDLNVQIASQRGVGLEDLAMTNGAASTSPDTQPDKPVTASEAYTDTNVVGGEQIDTTVLTEQQLADKYRSDATQLYREAKRLREEAEKLAPSKKKPTRKKAGDTDAKKQPKEANKEESRDRSMETDIQ